VRRGVALVHPRQILVHLTAPDEVAAIVVEPIQGRADTSCRRRRSCQGLRELTKQHGMLLVLDEVQSGMGRTGKMFAAEHFDVKGRHRQHREGDRVGTAARHHLRAGRRHELASRGSCEHLRRESRRLRGRARDHQAAARAVRAERGAVGEHMMNGLRALQEKHAIIGDVRGRGLMIGVELVRDRKTKERAADERNAVVQAMFRRGVLILGAGRNADPLRAAARADQGRRPTTSCACSTNR
jgi:4-aminobutyrate aminotransferase